MKEIKAIIQPFMLVNVINALKQIPHMPGVTVSKIQGFGRSRAEDTENSVNEWGILFVNKVKLETVVSDEMADQIVETIQTNSHTGNIGDGKIFIYDVQDIVKVRTGERGEKAL